MEGGSRQQDKRGTCPSGILTSHALTFVQNVAKAQKEIDRLEAEAVKAQEDGTDGRSRDDAKKTAQANAGVNGVVSAEAELQQEKDAVADATEELKAAKIEDATA